MDGRHCGEEVRERSQKASWHGNAEAAAVGTETRRSLAWGEAVFPPPANRGRTSGFSCSIHLQAQLLRTLLHLGTHFQRQKCNRLHSRGGQQRWDRFGLSRPPVCLSGLKAGGGKHVEKGDSFQARGPGMRREREGKHTVTKIFAQAGRSAAPKTSAAILGSWQPLGIIWS